MDESTILEVLKSIDNHIGTIAALALAVFMFGVGSLIFIIVNYYKK